MSTEDPTEIPDDPSRAQSDSNRAGIDSTRAGTDSTRALVDSEKAGTDSVQAVSDSTRAQADSDRLAGDSERLSADIEQRDRKDTQRLAAWIFFGIITALAIWYVQDLAQEAHDATDKLAAFIEAEDKEEDEETAKSCQLRNTFQRNSRTGDERIVDAFEAAFLLGAETPEAQAEVRTRAAEARAAVLKGRGPDIEDRDCDEDGELTEKDYAP